MPLDLPGLGRVRAERADLRPPGAALLAGLRTVSHLAVLDSAALGRYTVIAAAPMARLRWHAGEGEVLVPGGARARDEDFRALLRDAIRTTAAPGAGPLPLGPGWIGYLGYGLRTAFEDVPERHADETGLADVDLSYYPAVAVHDREEETWWLVWREAGAHAARMLRACLLGGGAPPVGAVKGGPEACIPRASYLEAGARAVEYVRAGDVFQVNYAHEFRAPFEGEALALYLRLRDRNPAPFSAYLDLGRGQAVLSTSPELFLRVRGRGVVTRPIKGTRPRGATDGEDRALREELDRSGKDAAELAMIVDLERNDLGRVCRPGTVRVVDAGRIESYASVHHRVAEVCGELEEGRDRVDLIEATFPGGSITGAPKVRAMEIIDELEAGRRGPYTGAIGIFADDGGMDLNIAIRTVVLAGGIARAHVGGGIVADSEPEAEYEETLDKGRAMFEAFSP